MAGGNETAKNSQTFSFETVAVLVAVLKDKGGNLGMKEYELMASLDGSRSASGFDHLFRKVKGRANELLVESKGKDGNGVAGTPVKKGSAGGKNSTPGTSGGTKRARKSKKGEDVDDEKSPSKKVKTEPKDEENGGTAQGLAGADEGDDEF